MIEVEKKAKLDEKQLAMIEKNSEFVKIDRFTDVYYDTEDFWLTKANVWLRQRASRFELKVGVDRQNGEIDRFEEIMDEGEILNRLGLSGKLAEALDDAEICPFCSFSTERKKYRWDGIGIDIDSSDFGDFDYRVAEFELMVPSETDIEDAEKRIKMLLGKLKLKEAAVPGKLIAYLKEKRPEHYRTLVDAQVIALNR